MGMTIETNADEILDRIVRARQRALTAAATEAVKMTKKKMRTGYPTPTHPDGKIWRTGDLIRSISYKRPDAETAVVGTNMEYALYVHDGTYKMPARPFLRDAMQEGAERLARIIAQELMK